jgi:uncharacterized protein
MRPHRWGERMNLNGRTVVVTGASQGIGERLAHEFTNKGARVLVAARSEDRLAAIARSHNGSFLTVDLTDPDQVDSFVDRCVERLGHIDVWVNNAGLDTSAAFTDLDHAALRSVIRLNVEATMILTRDVARHMLSRGSGHIVQMSSVAAVVPFPGLTAYAGTKAAITHFSESLRLELSRTPIGLTVVSPGPTATAMWDRIETGSQDFAEPVLRRFRRLAFLPTLHPDKVARATVRAVERNRPHVRLPRRYGPFHLLAHLPRQLVTMTMTGVRLDVPIPAEDSAHPGHTL